MTTALECERYRELFGARWCTSGRIPVKYVANIMTGVRLTAIGVVTAREAGRRELQTAVANEQQELVTSGAVSAATPRTARSEVHR